MYRMLPVAPPSQTPNLKYGFAVQKHGESDFYVIILLVEDLSGSLVVFKVHGGRYYPIRQNNTHHQKPKMWRPQNFMAHFWCRPCMLILIQRHQLPTPIIAS